MLLRWQNRPLDANWWRHHHGGGETPDSLTAKLDAAGIRYATTIGENDVQFLERCIEQRLGAMVTVMGGRHAILLVDLTPTHAALLDNNFPNTIQWVEREAFLNEWRASGSWSLTPLYSPVPALDRP